MSTLYYKAIDTDSFRYISHHGILGMKWGVRRYQNKDGSLTNAGKKRYGTEKSNDADLYRKMSSDERNTINSKHPDSPRTRKDPYDNMSEAGKAEVLKKSFKKMRDNCKTDEEKDRKVSAFDRANDSDKWNIIFLEAIQNSAIMYRSDKKAMLSEYANFLDDPNEYMKNGRHRLREV